MLKVSVLIFLQALILVPGSLAAIEQGAYTLERFHFEEEASPNLTVRVKNPYGDIRIRPAPNSKLIVHAVYQKIGKQALVPSMDIEKSELVIGFDFVYPSGKEPERLQDGRIDVVIIVPENMDLDIGLERGQLYSKSINNSIKVRSDASGLQLKTSGTVDAYSRVGDIELVLPKGVVSDSVLKTSKGNIDVSYQMDTDIKFDVTTTASITSNDLSLLQTRQIKKHNQVLSLGAPRSNLKVSSDVGHIRLINRNQIHH